MRAGRIILARNLLVYRHQPGLLAITLIAPLGMMLLFGFVFGGSLSGGDGDAYRAYIVPGMFVLVSAMGLVATASTANMDLHSGVTDRFRSLPISPGAVPFGLVLAETVAGIAALALMAPVALAVGWRIESSVGAAALAVGVVILARWTFSWLGILVGVSVSSQQMLQQVAPLIFGSVMLSNVFVPTETMPVVIRQIAEWNPASAFVEAVRELFGNAMTQPADVAWPLQHPVAASLIWVTALTAVSVPAAIRGFRT